MLKLYAVRVWHTSEPRHLETIEVRTYTAQRAEHLASESYPGCNAYAAREFVDGAWQHPTYDDQSPRRLKIA